MYYFVRIKCPFCDHLMVVQLDGDTYTIDKNESEYTLCKCPCCEEELLVSYEERDVVTWYEYADKAKLHTLVIH